MVAAVWLILLGSLVLLASLLHALRRQEQRVRDLAGELRWQKDVAARQGDLVRRAEAARQEALKDFAAQLKVLDDAVTVRLGQHDVELDALHKALAELQRHAAQHAERQTNYRNTLKNMVANNPRGAVIAAAEA
jgi:hypothetical protein